MPGCDGCKIGWGLVETTMVVVVVVVVGIAENRMPAPDELGGGIPLVQLTGTVGPGARGRGQR